MKRFFSVLFLTIISLFLFTACSAVATSSAVTLDPKLVVLLDAALLVLVTGFLKWLGSLLGFDITGGASVLASALGGVFVMIINGAFGLVDPAYDNWLVAIQNFLVIVLVGNGLYAGFWALRSGIRLTKK